MTSVEEGIRVTFPGQCGKAVVVEPNVVRFCQKAPHFEDEEHSTIFRGHTYVWPGERPVDPAEDS
jgi:hypothetical protein